MLQRAQRQRPPADPPPNGEDVRIGPFRSMRAVLRELGHDPDALLRAGGLDPATFDDPDRRIAFRTAADLIRRAALQCGREDFGLLIGERFTVDDFGLLGQLMWRARRVDEALHDLNRFLHIQDRGSVTFVRPVREGVVALGYSIFDADAPGVAMVYDLAIAVGMRLMRALAGPDFRALEVWLPHVAPRQRTTYRRVFGAPLIFDAPRAEIHFAADWLQAPLAGADAAQHERVQRAIRQAGVSPGLGGRTRAVLRALLMSGEATAVHVAAALGLHERTLRRRLAAEGESLQDMLAQARYEVACQLLRETRLGLHDIADALGYAEASVFVRAFRGWAGCTPGQWRVRTVVVSGRP